MCLTIPNFSAIASKQTAGHEDFLKVGFNKGCGEAHRQETIQIDKQDLLVLPRRESIVAEHLSDESMEVSQSLGCLT